MNKLVIAILIGLTCAMSALAHEPFTLISSQKRTVTEADVLAVEKERTAAVKDGSTLTFTQSEIRLLIVSGPEDDMLSYRVLGVRNPTIVVPAGATLRILFVNRDGDMPHDVRFGHVMGEFPIAPDLAETVGTDRLSGHDNESAPMQAQEIVIKAGEDGSYKYFCSVRGHAKGGMWGNLLVGVKAVANMQMPEKQTHVHSADEDKMGGMDMSKPGPSPTPEMDHDMPGMDMVSGREHGHMASTTNIGDPMSRESSGTAWAPDSSPMYAKMKMTAAGMWMFMGTGFLRYTQIGSSRNGSIAGQGSRSKFDAPTMFMAMYSHPIGEKSQFGFRAMASLDPIIERGFGYPLLYQSGEQYRGRPLHDRQHPHDVISELAVTFSHKFDEKRSLYLYAGYPGEPALGPPMYLHRNSGANMPDAPIGHHWQDATHITFGVVTAGLSFGKAKIEASAFNGTEPNENRYNFDKPRLNSFSGRLSVNPTKNWSLQVSHGYLKNTEPLEPEIRVLRKTTASAIYNKKLDEDHNWASTFVWGQNRANGGSTNAVLFESNYDFFKNAVFGRIETVQKSGHDLVLNPVDEDKIFRVNAFSLGYVRDVVQGKGIDVGLGSMLTINTNPSTLTSYYGGTTHAGWQVFMRFRPSKMH
jgi:uncharacterized cupredoxin-like copper-binding protein